MKIVGCVFVGMLMIARGASGGVIVVASDGSGDFPSIQEGVDAAADGDVVLVKPGSYVSFTVDGKGVSVIGDGDFPGEVDVLATGGTIVMGSGSGHTVVKNVPAGKQAVLRNMDLQGLEVRDCAGAVWIEIIYSHTIAPAVRIENCARVDTSGGGWLGPSAIGGASGLGGGNGLEVIASAVTMRETVCGGGKGSAGFVDATGSIVIPASPGFIGVKAIDSTIVAVLGHFGGGVGGDGAKGATSAQCTPGAEGGPGYDFVNSTVHLWKVMQTGGAGGSGATAGICGQGAHGPPGIATGGSVVSDESAGKSLELDSPVRELETTQVEISGKGGDTAIVFVDTRLSTGPALWTPGLGTLQLTPSMIFVGVFPLTSANGSFSVTLPPLAPGIAAIEVFAQAAFCRPGSGCAFIPGSELMVLSAAY